MKWITTSRKIFSTSMLWSFYSIAFAMVFSFFLLLFIGEDIFSIAIVEILALLLILLSFIIYGQIRGSRYPIKIGFDESRIILVYPKKSIEVPYEEITILRTSGRRKHMTALDSSQDIEYSKYGTIYFGWGTGGEFGLEMAEAFKKYMEERGHVVKVKKWYVGYFIRDYFYKYVVIDRTEEESLT